MTWLVPLPVILPLLGAGLTLMLSRRPALQRAVSTTVLRIERRRSGSSNAVL